MLKRNKRNIHKRKIQAALPNIVIINLFRKRLRIWYKQNKRDFPWRQSTDPYLICLSEIFLQQTKADKVSAIIYSFINRFPNWSSLANAKIKDIERIIFPLGIYRRRAKTVLVLARELVSKCDIPSTREGLEALPGIGQYIASVLLVVFQHKREPFLDVNMARVIERFFGPRKMADIRDDPYLQILSRKIINVPDALSANWMILDFASLICTKKVPKCQLCVLSEHCQKYQKDSK